MRDDVLDFNHGPNNESGVDYRREEEGYMVFRCEGLHPAVSVGGHSHVWVV